MYVRAVTIPHGVHVPSLDRHSTWALETLSRVQVTMMVSPRVRWDVNFPFQPSSEVTTLNWVGATQMPTDSSRCREEEPCVNLFGGRSHEKPYSASSWMRKASRNLLMGALPLTAGE